VEEARGDVKRTLLALLFADFWLLTFYQAGNIFVVADE
jgi:hypothetical protein